MSNRFAVVLVALIAVFGGFFVVSKKNAEEGTNGSNNAGSSAEVSKHVRGDNQKGVTFVEYGDYQCPACTAYEPIVSQVYEKYKADISFQYVNYPLIQLHPNAMAAHRAAEAAGLQNKYWEMHDLLYQHNPEWKGLSSGAAVSAFEGYASQLGLDLAKFKKDAASSAVNSVIQADLRQGQKLNVTATPTFYINGKKLEEPPRDVDGFSKLLDAAIAEKTTPKQ